MIHNSTKYEGELKRWEGKMNNSAEHKLDRGKITKKIAQEAFGKLVSDFSDDLNALLVNWHTGAELSSDEEKIKVCESWGGRATPSTSYEEPTEFIQWLVNDALDPKKMDVDDEWMNLVKRARKVAGI